MSHHSSLARAGEHVTSACSTLWLYWLVFSITASGTGTPGKRTFLLCHWIWSDRKFGLELQQLNCCHSEEACRKPGQLRGWRTQRGTRFWWHYLAFTTPWLTPHHPLELPDSLFQVSMVPVTRNRVLPAVTGFSPTCKCETVLKKEESQPD